MSDEVEDPDRRRMLSRVAGACGLALGAAVAIGPGGVAISPLVADDALPADGGPRWFSAGAVDAFRAGHARRVVLRRDVRDAWLVQRDVAIGVVLIMRLPDGAPEGGPAFRVLSAVCPHLGCTVSARANTPDASVGAGAAREWFCPCHDSSFALDGSLVPDRENPSPRGLDALPWRVTDGRLEVQWVRFATGTAEQRVIG